MTTAEELINRLRDQGVTFHLEGDQVRIDAPKGSISLQLRQELANHKEAILKLLLQAHQAATPSSELKAITPRPVRLPLSSGQQRMWFLHQMDANQSVYNMATSKRLAGFLDIPALERSLQEIVRRHEILRTIYVLQEGILVQHVLKEPDFQLLVEDLSHAEPTRKEQEGFLLAAQAHAIRFDLANDIMLRAVLVKLSDTDHILAVTMHHIASDGWSFGVFWHELDYFYSSFLEHRPDRLAEPSLQYADYALWQQRWLLSEQAQQQLAYWRETLTGLAPLTLPTDRPRPAIQSYHGADVYFHIPLEQLRQLRMLSKKEGVTLFMTLIAALSVLLQRYSGQKDIPVGTVIANRRYPDLEGLIGLFLNTLVLRTDLSGDPSFSQLLKQVCSTLLNAYDNQDVPFEALLDAFQPERDLGKNPFFQVLLVLQNTPGAQPRLSGVEVENVTHLKEYSKLDLSIYLEETQAGLRGTLEYNTDIFHEETIERLAAHFQVLLEQIVTDPDQRLSDLSLLTEEEAAALEAWNQTTPVVRRLSDVVEQFYSQVRRSPSATAFFEDERVLTFDDLNRRSNQLAHYLLDQGVRPGSRIGVGLTRSLDVPIVFLAILKIGGVYVPLDPGYPSQRLRFIVQDSDVSAIISTGERQALFAQDEHASPQVVVLDALSTTLMAQPDSDLHPNLSPDQDAYIIYTSGSTGQPKGVVVPHQQILNRLAWMWEAYPFQAGDIGCQKTALNFVDSLWELLGYLLQGVPCVIIPDEIVRDPRRLVDALSNHSVTQLWLVPSLLRVILQTMPDLQERLPLLRFWVSSGEPLPSDLAQQFREALPQATLYNLYGTSEVWDATWFDPRVEQTITENRSVPIGRPIHNVRAYILDIAGNPAPVGVPGELCIAGEGLAKGYINLPQATAERFETRPDGTVLYHSGDMARWLPDGNIEYLGRIDQQIKIRGHRVEPGEIEGLLRQRADIEDAVVISKEWGDEVRLIAFFLAVPGQEVKPTQLKEYLSSWLPEAMVPWQVIQLDAFPHTPSGKVDRKALAETQVDLDLAKHYIAPSTSLEEELASIWANVLQLPKVGVDDNFFELGGNSLLGVSLFAQIEAATGKSLPLTMLFQAPTIRRQAKAITNGEADHAEDPILVPFQTQGEQSPFFYVHGVYGDVLALAKIAPLLGNERPIYGLQAIGLQADAEPDRQIETMAARYVEAIRRVQPQGPYYLGGFCFGGVVAYEMARQLQDLGERTAMVAIIEGSAPQDYHQTASFLDPERLRIIWQSFPYWARGYKEFGGWRLREKAWALFKRSQQKEQANDSLNDNVEFDNAADFHALRPALQHRLHDINLQAILSYEPRPLDSSVTFFRARCVRVKHALFEPIDPFRGWRTLTSDRVEMRYIAGDHHHVVAEPGVSDLGRQLAMTLCELQAE